LRLSRRSAAVALVLIWFLAPRAAADVVETRLLPWSTATVEEGLAELRRQFLDDSRRNDREHVGAVLRAPDGSLRFTHGIAWHGQDRVSFRSGAFGELELLGYWHTHGADGPHRELFSPGDAGMVRQSGLPFYLIDPRITPRGSIR
jgi:hypothetical protein